MKVRCKNCRLEFKADDRSRVSRCPRCDSDRLDITRDPLPVVPIENKPSDTQVGATPTTGASKPALGHEAPKVYSSGGSVVYGDTKDAWKSYHSNPTGGTGCPHCGGTAFEFNYKRKEKICKKCGEILPLPRRMA